MGRMKNGFGCPVAKQTGTRGSGPGARQQWSHLPTSVEGDVEAGLPVRGTWGDPRNMEHMGYESWAGQK